MKNTIKFLTLALMGLSLTACSADDLADPQLQGSWALTWVKDFTADIPNAAVLGALCEPGATVDLGIAGVGEMRFSGNRSASENNGYIRMGNRNDNSTPAATLASKSFYVDCSDITVSSIEHRDIYITGQPGYITKVVENGRCLLKSERARTRPKYTVFMKLTGSQSRVVNGQTVYDDNNRLGGITYDCDDRRLEAVSRVAGAGNAAPLVTPTTLQNLKKNSNVLNEKSGLFKTSK